MIWRTWWLRDGWNSVILHKLLHSAGSVSRCITRVQYPIITQFFCPLWINGIHPNVTDLKYKNLHSPFILQGISYCTTPKMSKLLSINLVLKFCKPDSSFRWCVGVSFRGSQAKFQDSSSVIIFNWTFAVCVDSVLQKALVTHLHSTASNGLLTCLNLTEFAS